MRRVGLLVLAFLVVFTANAEPPGTAAGGKVVPTVGRPSAPPGSITSLFSSNLASGLSKAQSVTISVRHGATFTEEQGFAPNTFLSIFSPNGLVPATQSWNAFFQDGVAPTELEGLRVLVNGKRGFISFLLRGADFGINFDQINFISRDDDARGDGILVQQCCPGKVAPTDGKSLPLNVLWSVLPGNDLKSRGRKWPPERSIPTRHNGG